MDYKLLKKQVESLVFGYNNLIGNLSNISALLYNALDNVNWVGFYFRNNDLLELGPFQGKIACMEINIGKGVCGTSVKENKPILVNNVHEFPGHIACDSASNSEIVIPIKKGNEIFGVLDIDSPILNRFINDDLNGLIEIVKVIENMIK